VTTMPFGKYRGEEIEAIPTSSLRWLAGLDLRRDHAREVVSARLRVVSKRNHPDVGGSHGALVRLTHVAEWLETVVGIGSAS